MRVEVTDKPLAEDESDLLAVLVFDGDDLPEPLAGAPGSEDVKGGYRKTTLIHPEKPRRALVVGLGDRDEFEPERARVAAAIAARTAGSMDVTSMTLRGPDAADPKALATAAVEGAILGSYRFDRYKSKKEPDDGDGGSSKHLEELQVIVPGLIAGTIGNIRAAVPIVIKDFYTQCDVHGRPLIDDARRASREGGPRLRELITEALVRNPPAGFLARTSRSLPPNVAAPTFRDQHGKDRAIPEGAHVLLALGASRKKSLVFGGMPSTFMHQCVGEHLAWPLIETIVREVLLLPGLSRKIDQVSGLPSELKKRWGAMCESFKLRYQRDRRLNQQPLFVVLPIAEPVQQNAAILERLTRYGAHVVDESLRESKIVHFAWFALVENRTHLALSTVYDGNFDAYVEYFATNVPLFDEQFKYLAVDQPTPIARYPKEFVENIRKYNRAPLADYFFSAYPLTSVAQVDNAKEVP